MTNLASTAGFEPFASDPARTPTLDAIEGRLTGLGGLPFGETILMWWNFVARTPVEIAGAREDWMAGHRFGEVSAYPGRRLDAPPFTARAGAI